MKLSEKISLTLPNNLQYLPASIQFVEQICSLHGFDENTCQSIVMACEEALANVIQHAFKAEDRESLILTLNPIATGIEITIADKGLPYDPSAIQFDEETLSGLGNYLIGKLMDKVSFNNLGKAGKALVLTKYFANTETIEPIVPLEETISKETPLEYEYTYRAFEDKDAVEIARCAYESYGYTYSYEHIYFPERVRALNQSGDLISLVAVAHTGEIAGHVGMVKFDHVTGLYEIGLAMTKQKFRGGNIFSKLMDLAIDQAKARGFKAIFGQCVTTHTYSQGQPTKLGMLPTALLPAYVPDDITFKKIADSVPRRTGILIVSKFLTQRATQQVFVPEKYKNIVGNIYSQFEGDFEICSQTENLNFKENAASKLEFSTYLKMGKLFFDHYGLDFSLHLKKHIQQFKKEQIQMVEAFVNLNSAEAILIIKEAEEMGFVFTGLLPGAVEGDFGILQYLNGPDANIEAIKVIEVGQPLLNFIKSQFD